MDPQGTQFSDALPKLQGLARYAGTHPQVGRRIEAIAKVGDRLRVLDLTELAVRQAVVAAKEARLQNHRQRTPCAAPSPDAHAASRVTLG